jgi:hypothetical protein
MVDASIVEVPRHRNSHEENAQIKAGQTPESWRQMPNKLRQKDCDARWLLLRPLKVSIVGGIRVEPDVILSVAKNPELFVS